MIIIQKLKLVLLLTVTATLNLNILAQDVFPDGKPAINKYVNIIRCSYPMIKTTLLILYSNIK